LYLLALPGAYKREWPRREGNKLSEVMSGLPALMTRMKAGILHKACGRLKRNLVRGSSLPRGFVS
jgi:hypothetical protein